LASTSTLIPATVTLDEISEVFVVVVVAAVDVVIFGVVTVGVIGVVVVAVAVVVTITVDKLELVFITDFAEEIDSLVCLESVAAADLPNAVVSAAVVAVAVAAVAAIVAAVAAVLDFSGVIFFTSLTFSPVDLGGCCCC